MSLTYPENQQHNSFNTPWTAERDEMLKQLWADGYSASLIADKLANGSKLTRCAVIGRAHRLELPARKDRPPLERKPYRRAKGARKPPRPPPPPPPRPLQPSRLRPAAPVPSPPTEPPAMRKLPLLELKPHHCRWPCGEPQLPGFFFCAADKTEDSSYCPYHRRLSRPPERVR
jgi:GcrA cell cycle regulator